MKIWIKTLSILTVLGLALAACKKDDDKLVVNTTNTPVLTASASTLVLDIDSASSFAVQFSWDSLQFSWSNPAVAHSLSVDYVLQLDSAGNDFKKAVSSDMGSALSKSFLVSDFNKLVNQLGLAYGKPHAIQLRIKALSAPNAQPVYSSPINMTVTNYKELGPLLFVLGSYQNWNTASVDTIVSADTNRVYDGYVYFPDASTQFKFTTDPSQSSSYLDAGNGTSGVISTTGTGNNMTVTGPGYYLLHADLKANTWSATPYAWAIIGDATGSWSTDQPLTYDPVNKVLKITLNLQVGSIKFRANESWDVNLGAGSTANGLSFGGPNIPIATAGQYEVTLNLKVAGNYNYSLKQL